MIQKTALLRIDKSIQIKGIAIALALVLIVLFCIDGEAYAQCLSIYPDEIMDVSFFISVSSWMFERPIDYALREDLPSRASGTGYTTLSNSVYSKRMGLFLECIQLKGSKVIFLVFMRCIC